MSRKHEEEEHENHERWAVSYADMMTVLVALFIVLYAMSQVDEAKFEALKESLAVGFGKDATVVLTGSTGALTGLDAFQVSPDFSSVANDTSEMVSGSDSEDASDGTDTADQVDPNYLEAAAEYEDLTAIEKKLQAKLADQGLDANVSFLIDERGLVIGLVGSKVFFAADDAAMTDRAKKVVGTLSGPLKRQTRQISIEGHANLLPSSRYATNWELSAARAVAVLRRFVEKGGVSEDQISATGYGDARPLLEGDSEEALEANRRVEIVVESPSSEEIRALIAQISEEIDAGNVTHEELQSQLAELRIKEMGEL
ncbi:OmpA/MotB family protein [Demequina salsinemoris]|uniref:OmpA/MotB family protein n=1 Tax=Demequina salsinemoris TaxID=577470 RepID=UPI000782C37B|nr:flagellar motor protein MotB [Demequina salsinemoris]